MTVKSRATLLIVGLLCLGLALGAYQWSRLHGAQKPLKIDTASDGSVDDFLSGGESGPSLVNYALAHLEEGYYKPVNPQTPFIGEAKQLQLFLAKKGIAHVTLPPEIATGDESADADKLNDVLAYAEKQYGPKLGASADVQLTQAALAGMLSSVKDPYTVYFPPREYQQLNEQLNGGDFGGIGVYILTAPDHSIVVIPIDKMPAALSGMKAGEVVDTVDGVSLKGVDVDHAMQMIRGEAGTTVRLTSHAYPTKHHTSRGPEHTYTIVRSIIHVPTVTAKMEDGFDYIRLSDFGETSADEMKTALEDGKAHHAKGYILDLRDNGGGYVKAAVEISSYFIPQGTIVSTISRDGQPVPEDALGDPIGGLQPLVILVNGYTASASEITSGALQDYHLATLIGTKTFGKGVVQSIYPMPDNGALKITTSRYVTPLGRDLQHKGIEPDVVVVQSTDPSLIDTPLDLQLAAAKARLRHLNR